MSFDEILNNISIPHTPIERIELAIKLEVPDRTPIAPVTTMHTPTDLNKIDMIIEEAFVRYGGFDGFLLHPSTLTTGLLYTPCKPDLTEAIQTMKTSNGYDEIVQGGFMSYVSHVYRELELDTDIERTVFSAAESIKAFASKWEHERKIPVYAGAMGIVPFGFLSYQRGLLEIMKDIIRYPGKVTDACYTIADEMTEVLIKLAKISTVPRLWLSFINSMPDVLGLPYFSSFVWPTAKIMINKLIEAEVTPILQFDVDASSIFKFIKELPERECILHFDSSTDIFDAKNEVGNHSCIMGNVSFLKLATPKEIESYCKKLIAEVGKEGGFILSSDRPLLMDEEAPEKIKALINIEKYGKII